MDELRTSLTAVLFHISRSAALLAALYDHEEVVSAPYQTDLGAVPPCDLGPAKLFPGLCVMKCQFSVNPSLTGMLMWAVSNGELFPSCRTNTLMMSEMPLSLVHSTKVSTG